MIACPDIDTDELVADIAAVFHWPPSEYDAMTVSDLLKWHRRAAIRAGQDDE